MEEEETDVSTRQKRLRQMGNKVDGTDRLTLVTDYRDTSASDDLQRHLKK